MEIVEEELPPPDEVTGLGLTHLPEREGRRDVRRSLELVTNRVGIHPQPQRSRIVEGHSEEAAGMPIFEEYHAAHPGLSSMEIIGLGGGGAATGNTKADRFRAILRLGDSRHHHQTCPFLILDNENDAKRLKGEAKTAKSIHRGRQYVTRPEYSRSWKDSFAFDNFSCTEIAVALNELAQRPAPFPVQDVARVKSQANPGAALKPLSCQKTKGHLPKVELREIVVRNRLAPAGRRKIESRPIIKTWERVRHLATGNALPITQNVWATNQASKYFGRRSASARR